jgi:hypothetical protein
MIFPFSDPGPLPGKKEILVEKNIYLAIFSVQGRIS